MTDETAATNAAPDAIAPETQGAESAPAKVEAPEKDSFTKRIDELTRNWRETERVAQESSREAREAARERDYWHAKAMEGQPPKEPVSQVKTLADFEYDDAKYQAHVLEQAGQQATKAAAKLLKEQADADTKQKRIAKYHERISVFEKTTPDYQEKIRSGVFSDAMAEVITESDEGPAVAYYLASNRSLAESIYAMPPLAAAREIGRIEANLIAEREKAAKKVSAAPPPPPKIDGSGDPQVEKDPKDWTDSEFAKWRRKHMK